MAADRPTRIAPGRQVQVVLHFSVPSTVTACGGPLTVRYSFWLGHHSLTDDGGGLDACGVLTRP